MTNLDESIVLKKGESFECLFEIEVGDKPKDISLSEIILGEGEVSRQQLLMPISKSDDPIK